MPGSLLPLPEVGLRVLRNPVKDSLEINLNQSAIWNGIRTLKSAPPFKLQVFTTAPGALQTSDLTQPVGSQDQPPAQAPLLLAYWNTLPAYTPAQALRRWDGAHTGPQGGRHGLYNLLRTARNAGIPLLLLDLNSSQSLAALDYLENLTLVNELAQTDEVILPSKVPGFLLQESSSGVDRILEGMRQDAAPFALPSNRLLFVDGASPADWDVDSWLASQKKPGVIFFPRLAIEPGAGSLPDQVTHVSRWHDWRVIPIPWVKPGFQQVSQEGLSLEARRLLVQTAFQNQEQDAPAMVILGGNLPASEWGNPENSREAFAYIRAHPWIKPVTRKDLFTLRTLPADDSLLEFTAPSTDLLESAVEQELVEALKDAPANNLGRAARQAFEALLAPLANPPQEYPALRRQYIGQVYALLAAARWAEQPSPASDCSLDYNQDARLDCLLATDTTLALFDNQEGTLSFLFTITPDGEDHQLIGPSSQLIVGLSDPSSWDLVGGLRADPAVIPGAFAEPLIGTGRTQDVQVALSPEIITFSYASELTGAPVLSKRFFLGQNELRVEYDLASNPPPIKIQLPVLLDPWERFTSGWVNQYQQERLASGWSWSHSPGLLLEITASEDISLRSFLDSRRYLGQAEDPNREYPASHYLPFPLAMAELHPQGDFYVNLRLTAVP
jgi:hypothetical protein